MLKKIFSIKPSNYALSWNQRSTNLEITSRPADAVRDLPNLEKFELESPRHGITKHIAQEMYPLVNIQKTMEKSTIFMGNFTISMVIFHSYVKLPEMYVRHLLVSQ